MSTTQTPSRFPGLPRSATLGQVIDWLNRLRLFLGVVPPVTANAFSYVANASEALSAGNFTNSYSNSGTLNVRKADATDPLKFCNGFVLEDVANGSAATVYFGGVNTGVTVATPSSDVFLSDTSTGTFTTTVPTTVGHIVQKIGVGIPGTGVAFHEGESVEL